MADHADPNQSSDWKPFFSNEFRTFVYCTCAVAYVVGLGFQTFGDPTVGKFINDAAGAIGLAFGVAYNPLRLASK